jgi:phosphoenolpyruvate carboxylase
LPPGSASGDLRLTEQGEVIAQRYATVARAAQSLEVFVSGLCEGALRGDARHADAPRLEAALDQLAKESRSAYEALVRAEGFVSFFRQATPIDAIEGGRIGSRPPRRSGQVSISDLRAIPWVFAWSQARFHLSGWFGFGSAFRALAERDRAAHALLSASFQSWAPLHYIVSNVATSVAKVDVDVCRAYATLVKDAALRDKFLSAILDELARTREVLEELYGGELATKRPRVAVPLARRTARLGALHTHQIALLRALREKENGTPEHEALLLRALVTVNAIASGLGATG